MTRKDKSVALLRITLLCAWAVISILATRPVQASTIIVTNTLDAGPGSLRQAVLSAAPSGDIIVFSPVQFNDPQTITLSEQILVTKSLTIDGLGGGIY